MILYSLSLILSQGYYIPPEKREFRERTERERERMLVL